MAHANFSHWNTFAPRALRPPARPSHLLVCRRTSASCGHAFPAAPCTHRRMLLPLRGIQSARRLCQDVRVQKIRVSLVGHQLRQASHEHAAPRLSCRPALSASPQHRTRSFVIAGPKKKKISSRPWRHERILDSGSCLWAVHLKASQRFPEPQRSLDCFALQHSFETPPA